MSPAMRLHERRLARAVGADDGEGGTRGDLERGVDPALRHAHIHLEPHRATPGTQRSRSPTSTPIETAMSTRESTIALGTSCCSCR